MALFMECHPEYRGPGGLTARQVYQHAMAGDPLAARVVERENFYLGIGLANLVNLFVPDAIILGGSVMKGAGAFLEDIRRVMQRGCRFVPLDKVEVALGDTTLPPGPISGGSMATGSVVPAVFAAAEDGFAGVENQAPLDLRCRMAVALEAVDRKNGPDLFVEELGALEPVAAGEHEPAHDVESLPVGAQQMGRARRQVRHHRVNELLVGAVDMRPQITEEDHKSE